MEKLCLSNPKFSPALKGNVSDLLEAMMGLDTEFVFIDKQTDDKIVHQSSLYDRYFSPVLPKPPTPRSLVPNSLSI